MPSFNEGLHIRIRIIGEYLEVRETNSPARPVSWTAWTAEESALLQTPTNRGVVVFDPGLLMGFLFASEYDDSGVIPGGNLPPDQQGDLQSLHSKLATAKRDLQIAIASRVVSGADKFGRIVVSVQNYENGYALIGDLFGNSIHIGRGMQTLVEIFSTAAEEMRTNKPSRIDELRKELRALRRTKRSLKAIIDKN